MFCQWLRKLCVRKKRTRVIQKRPGERIVGFDIPEGRKRKRVPKFTKRLDLSKLGPEAHDL